MTAVASRLLTLALAVVAIILAAVVLIAHPADTVNLLAWAGVCVGAAVVVLAL